MYFLNLKSTTVPASKIEETFRKIPSIFKTFNEKLRKRNKRGKFIRVMGIRTLECTFNLTARTYNPHYHLLVNGKPAAILLREEWIEAWKPTYLSPDAQHLKKVKNTEKDLVEVVKYGAKFLPNRVKQKKKKNIAAMKA